MSTRLVRRAEQVKQVLAAERQLLSQLHVVANASHEFVETAISAGMAPDKEELDERFRTLNNIATNLQMVRESRLRGSDILANEVLAEAGIQHSEAYPEGLLPTIHTNVSGEAGTAHMLAPGGSVDVTDGGTFHVSGSRVATMSDVTDAIQSVRDSIDAAHSGALQQVGQLQLLEQSCFALLSRAEEVALECRDAIRVERIVGWNGNTSKQLGDLQTDLNDVRLRLGQVEEALHMYSSNLNSADVLIGRVGGDLAKLVNAYEVAVEDRYALRAGLAVPRLIDLEVLAAQLDRLSRVEHLVTAGWPDVGVVEPQFLDMLNKSINGHLLGYALPLMLQRYILPVISGLPSGEYLSPYPAIDLNETVGFSEIRERGLGEVDLRGMAADLLVRVTEVCADKCRPFLTDVTTALLVLNQESALSRLMTHRQKGISGGGLWRSERFEYALPLANSIVHEFNRASVEQAGRHSRLRPLVGTTRRLSEMQQATILRGTSTAEIFGETLTDQQQKLDLGQYSRAARGVFYAGTMQSARRVSSQTGAVVPGYVTYIAADLSPANEARFGMTASEMKFEYVRALQLGRVISTLPGMNNQNSVHSKTRGVLVLMAPNRRDMTALNDIAYRVMTDDDDPVDLRVLLEALYQHPEPSAVATLAAEDFRVVNSTGSVDFVLLQSGVTLQMGLMFSGQFSRLRNCAPFAMYVAFGGGEEVDNFEPLLGDGIYVTDTFRHTLALDSGGISWNYGRVSEVGARGVFPVTLDVSNVTGDLGDVISVDLLNLTESGSTVTSANGLFGISYEPDHFGQAAFRLSKGVANWYLPVSAHPHDAPAGGPGRLPFAGYDDYNTVDSPMRFFVHESVWREQGHGLSRVFGFPIRDYEYSIRGIEERHGNVLVDADSAMFVESSGAGAGRVWNTNVLDRGLVVSNQGAVTDVAALLESNDVTDRLDGLRRLPRIAYELGVETIDNALMMYMNSASHSSWQSAYRRMTVLDMSSVVGIPMSPPYTLSMAQLQSSSETAPKLHGTSLALLVLDCVRGQYRGSVAVDIPLIVTLSKSNGVLEKAFSGAYSTIQTDLLLRPSSDIAQGIEDPGLSTVQDVLGGVTIDLNPVVQAFVADARRSMHVQFVFHVVLRPRSIEPAVDMPPDLQTFVVCESLGAATGRFEYTPAGLLDATYFSLYTPNNLRVSPAIPAFNVPDTSLKALMQWTDQAAGLQNMLVDMQAQLGPDWQFALPL